MQDELIAAVARAAKLTPHEAALAVSAALRFFTARLPSSLVGELHAHLQTRGGSRDAAPHHSGVVHTPESKP